MDICLREITTADQEQLLQMKREIEALDGNFEGFTRLRAVDDFLVFMEKLERSKHRELLLPGFSPETTYAAVNQAGHVVGVIVIRTELTEKLRCHGGNIGYLVRPRERNKGFGTAMLKAAVDKCRGTAMRRVLVTCRKENIASVKVVERDQGVYENDYITPEDGVCYQRYWIAL